MILPFSSVGGNRKADAVRHSSGSPRVEHVELALHNNYRRIVHVVDPFRSKDHALWFPDLMVCGRGEMNPIVPVAALSAVIHEQGATVANNVGSIHITVAMRRFIVDAGAANHTHGIGRGDHVGRRNQGDSDDEKVDHVKDNTLRIRVATVDDVFKFGVNRHSGSRFCYAATCD